jgi:hypothetical protein
MPIVRPRMRHNRLAIVVAALACSLLLAAWYTLFLGIWLQGIGRSRAWLDGTQVSQFLQCCTLYLSAGLLAALISGLTQLSGAMNARRGMKVAVFLWMGCILPVQATQAAFELRGYGLFALNSGFWLLAMLLMGAIVGAWKRKGVQ